MARRTRRRAFADYRELLGRVDAVSIVTPTPSHFAIAREFLEAGAHVLVEKPMTATLAEGGSLIAAARRASKRMLQVGHLERFNAAVQAVQPMLGAAVHRVRARLAPFKQRGTDVNVVLDLMIHDIDLILSIVRSPVVSVDAIGSSVFSGEIDIANARLRFANGCVANATASRVSLKTERRLRLFQDDAYVSVDLQQKVLTVIRKRTGCRRRRMPQVDIEETQLRTGRCAEGGDRGLPRPPPRPAPAGHRRGRTDRRCAPRLLIGEQVVRFAPVAFFRSNLSLNGENSCTTGLGRIAVRGRYQQHAAIQRVHRVEQVAWVVFKPSTRPHSALTSPRCSTVCRSTHAFRGARPA